MLGDVPRNVAPGAVSLALPNRPVSGSERRKIVAALSCDSPTSRTWVRKSADMAAAPEIIAHFVAREKHRNYKCLEEWSEWQDSNLRPLRPERSALPG